MWLVLQLVSLNDPKTSAIAQHSPRTLLKYYWLRLYQGATVLDIRLVTRASCKPIPSMTIAAAVASAKLFEQSFVLLSVSLGFLCLPVLRQPDRQCLERPHRLRLQRQHGETKISRRLWEAFLSFTFRLRSVPSEYFSLLPSKNVHSPDLLA